MLSGVSELPVMFFSVALLRRRRGTRVAAAMLLYVLRFLFYGAMNSADWVLFIIWRLAWLRHVLDRCRHLHQ